MNCERCEDKGYTESAYCLMSYHTHGWISTYDKSRGGCTTPCECGFDPEEVEEEAQPTLNYGPRIWEGRSWLPSAWVMDQEQAPFSDLPISEEDQFQMLLQLEHTQAHSWTERVTTDVPVTGVNEETQRPCTVPAYLAGVPVEYERGYKLIVRYTFMSRSLHVAYAGTAALNKFRFAHSWDDTFDTKELMT